MTDADREEIPSLAGDDLSEISTKTLAKSPTSIPMSPDIEIVARVRAAELRFDAAPEVEVRFRGSGKRDSRQVTTRKNIDKPIKLGKTYRRVFVATRISTRLLDADGVG